MRGPEPPRGCPHGDLNAARLPIPPHPLAVARIADGRGGLRSACDDPELDGLRCVSGVICVSDSVAQRLDGSPMFPHRLHAVGAGLTPEAAIHGDAEFIDVSGGGLMSAP